jgi:hypothetical protein
MKGGFLRLLVVVLFYGGSIAWSPSSITENSQTSASEARKNLPVSPRGPVSTRREHVASIAAFVFSAASSAGSKPATAYTPDPDKLRESLYLMSRVQEATVQQERFVNKATLQQDLKVKMKLTLRLVEKNYRLLDQINYASSFVTPKDDLVLASEAGYEAVDALQGAIDFVSDDLGEGPLSEAQRTFLTTAMQSCRENLFVFLKYMPQDKVMAARKRVEEENVLNRDEFDGDADAGVYNPVVLPWKVQSSNH